jgi:hypothetical protein
MTGATYDQNMHAAHHEAGHAVVAYRHNNWVRERGVWIEDGGGGCHTRAQAWPGEGKRTAPEYWQAYLHRLEGDIQEYQAGWLAEVCPAIYNGPAGPRTADDVREALWDNHCVEPGGDEWDDLATAAYYLADARKAEVGRDDLSTLDEEFIVNWYLRIQSRVLEYIWEPPTWNAISTVAGELMVKGKLSEEEADAILERISPPQMPIVDLTEPPIHAGVVMAGPAVTPEYADQVAAPV